MMERISEFLDTLGWCWCLRKKQSMPGINTKVPVFCIMGPTGCGKSSVARALTVHTNFCLIDVNELVKEKMLKLAYFGDSQAPDEYVVNFVYQYIDDVKHNVSGFILDGFPQNPYQLKIFTTEVYEPRFIIYLTLTEDEFKYRYFNQVDVEEKVNKFREETVLLNKIYIKYEMKTLKLLCNMPTPTIVERLILYLETYYGFRINKTNI